MQCNIDAKGKAVRLLLGVLLIIGGVGVLLLGWRSWQSYAAITFILVGAFCIWEGWSGWCALRALGYKTRL